MSLPRLFPIPYDNCLFAVLKAIRERLLRLQLGQELHETEREFLGRLLRIADGESDK